MEGARETTLEVFNEPWRYSRAQGEGEEGRGGVRELKKGWRGRERGREQQGCWLPADVTLPVTPWSPHTHTRTQTHSPPLSCDALSPFLCLHHSPAATPPCSPSLSLSLSAVYSVLMLPPRASLHISAKFNHQRPIIRSSISGINWE